MPTRACSHLSRRSLMLAALAAVRDVLPDVPAVAETLPGYQYPLWTGLFAPAKTPKPIIDRLAAEIGKAMRDAAVMKRYADVKVEAIGSTPEEFDRFFREQLKFNEDVIKRANIQLE